MQKTILHGRYETTCAVDIRETTAEEVDVMYRFNILQVSCIMLNVNFTVKAVHTVKVLVKNMAKFMGLLLSPPS